MKLGGAVATVLHPVAEVSDYLFGTDLQNCSTCKKREQKLDLLGDSIYDFLFEPENKDK